MLTILHCVTLIGPSPPLMPFPYRVPFSFRVKHNPLNLPIVGLEGCRYIHEVKALLDVQLKDFLAANPSYRVYTGGAHACLVTDDKNAPLLPTIEGHVLFIVQNWHAESATGMAT